MSCEGHQQFKHDGIIIYFFYIYLCGIIHIGYGIGRENIPCWDGRWWCMLMLTTWVVGDTSYLQRLVMQVLESHVGKLIHELSGYGALYKQDTGMVCQHIIRCLLCKKLRPDYHQLRYGYLLVSIFLLGLVYRYSGIALIVAVRSSAWMKRRKDLTFSK